VGGVAGKLRIEERGNGATETYDQAIYTFFRGMS
jgi:hypothetical protein